MPAPIVGGVALCIHRCAEAFRKHEHLHFKGGGFWIFVVVIQKRICSRCWLFMRLRFESKPLYRVGNFVRKRRFARSDVAFQNNYTVLYSHGFTSQKDAQSSSAILSIIVRALSAPNDTKIGFMPYLALGMYDSLSRSMKAIFTVTKNLVTVKIAFALNGRKHCTSNDSFRRHHFPLTSSPRIDATRSFSALHLAKACRAFT